MSGAVYVVTVVLELSDPLPIDQIKQHVQDAINDGAPEPLMRHLKTTRVSHGVKIPDQVLRVPK